MPMVCNDDVERGQQTLGKSVIITSNSLGGNDDEIDLKLRIDDFNAIVQRPRQSLKIWEILPLGPINWLFTIHRRLPDNFSWHYLAVHSAMVLVMEAEKRRKSGLPPHRRTRMTDFDVIDRFGIPMIFTKQFEEGIFQFVNPGWITPRLMWSLIFVGLYDCVSCFSLCPTSELNGTDKIHSWIWMAYVLRTGVGQTERRVGSRNFAQILFLGTWGAWVARSAKVLPDGFLYSTPILAPIDLSGLGPMTIFLDVCYISMGMAWADAYINWDILTFGTSLADQPRSILPVPGRIIAQQVWLVICFNVYASPLCLFYGFCFSLAFVPPINRHRSKFLLGEPPSGYLRNCCDARILGATLGLVGICYCTYRWVLQTLGIVPHVMSP